MWRTTIWFKEYDAILAFDHPYANDPKYPHEEVAFDTTDMNSNEAIGILEYMAQTDNWCGIFYGLQHPTRIRVEETDG